MHGELSYEQRERKKWRRNGKQEKEEVDGIYMYINAHTLTCDDMRAKKRKRRRKKTQHIGIAFPLRHRTYEK